MSVLKKLVITYGDDHESVMRVRVRINTQDDVDDGKGKVAWMGMYESSRLHRKIGRVYVKRGTDVVTLQKRFQLCMLCEEKRFFPNLSPHLKWIHDVEALQTLSLELGTGIMMF